MALAKVWTTEEIIELLPNLPVVVMSGERSWLEEIINGIRFVRTNTNGVHSPDTLWLREASYIAFRTTALHKYSCDSLFDYFEKQGLCINLLEASPVPALLLCSDTDPKIFPFSAVALIF